MGREGPRVHRLSRRRRRELADRKVPGRPEFERWREPGTRCCSWPTTRDRLEGARSAAAEARPRARAYRRVAVEFLWVVDMPAVRRDAEAERWIAAHHPFTRPTEDRSSSVKTDPALASAVAYDLVGNGIELAGGSFRIHEPRLQQQVFELLGIGGRSSVEVRLPARRARDGRAPARRHRVRDRPADDGAPERAVHPRHAGVPEEPGRGRLDDRRADGVEPPQLRELGLAVTVD